MKTNDSKCKKCIAFLICRPSINTNSSRCKCFLGSLEECTEPAQSNIAMIFKWRFLEMTKKQKESQRRNFVYGNLKIADNNISKKLVLDLSKHILNTYLLDKNVLSKKI